MSFYRIEDPAKRNQLVKEYIATAKRLRDRSLNERIGEASRQSVLNDHWAPVLESNENVVKQIEKNLQPIKKEVKDINRYIKHEEINHEDIRDDDSYFDDFKRKVLADEEVDTSTGIRFIPGGGNAMGGKLVQIDRDDNIHVDGEVYDGTSGLWRLITGVRKDQIGEYGVDYTEEDLLNYIKLVQQTNVLHRDFNPESPFPRSNKSWKWNHIQKSLWSTFKRTGSGLESFVQKGRKCYRIHPIDGNGLYLSPHRRLRGVGNGLFVKHGPAYYNGEGILFGSNSPFRNIPILQWFL